jgi:tetratricopeptide (TPR) repeat protein
MKRSWVFFAVVVMILAGLVGYPDAASTAQQKKPTAQEKMATIDYLVGSWSCGPLAAAAILNQLAEPGGAALVKQQLIEARRKDPKVQLWPEVSADIIGSGLLREGESKAAVEIFQLNLLAYPDSADAHCNLADAYLEDGQKDLARQYAEKALALLDSHTAPLSSWSDTAERRAEIRQGIQDMLKKLANGKK